MLKNGNNEKLWETIRNADCYADFRKTLSDFYDEMNEEIPVLKFNDFIDYFKTGTRLMYEKKYFHRRGQLIAAAGMYLIEKEEEYLNRLEDVIWAICDEYTWALPAHILNEQNTEKSRVYIDLFAGETSFALSEICALIGDKLHPWVYDRVKHEIERRIILSYESSHFFWENVEMNWAAVCCGSVGACYMYLFPERFAAVKERMINTMKCFLHGFGTDGCCREGMSYWNYGFGFFTYFADLLLQFTDGQDDLFAEETAHLAAGFQQQAFLNPTTVISFADCGPDSKVEPGIISYLAQHYGGGVFCTGVSADILDLNDRCRRWTAFIRNLLWSNDEVTKPKRPDDFHYFADAQWYINHRGPFALAAKGGHNDEPHNHNDLGGFILADDSEQILCDFGSGLYTHAYFQPETRYNVVTNSSFGHSVPIIDGEGQTPGADIHASVIRADKNVFELDIAQAYDVDGLNGAVRRIEVTGDRITITDRFEFTKGVHGIKERFVTFHEPLQTEGAVRVKNMEIKTAQRAVVSTDIFTDHFGREHIYYIIDFNVNGDVFEVEFCRG